MRFNPNPVDKSVILFQSKRIESLEKVLGELNAFIQEQQNVGKLLVDEQDGRNRRASAPSPDLDSFLGLLRRFAAVTPKLRHKILESLELSPLAQIFYV